MRLRKTQRHSFYLFSIVFGLLLCAQTTISSAADISRDVRTGREDESIDHGGYLEIGFTAGYSGLPVVGAETNYFNITLGGHYRFRRFFIDALVEGYNQFQLGLNLYSGPNWSVDLLGAASERGIDSNFSDELDTFIDRPPAFNGGLRATTYSGEFIAQLEALQDISDTHNGFTLTGIFGRKWLVRNWNLHALVGARFQSGAVLDYQFGIDSDEATDRFPAYEADSGTTFVTEFGITYPINEYWVFRGTARWWEVPHSVFNSPFITGEDYLVATGSLTFVY